MLDKEYQFYKNHQKDLLGKYRGKVLVIKDEEVVGVYEDEIQAYEEASSKFELGNFLIQKCLPEEETAQTFHSRVVFQ